MSLTLSTNKLNKYLLFIGSVMAILGIPMLLSPNLERPLTRQAVMAIDPDIIMIGNSMLESRIDTQHLSDILNGKTVVSMVDGGLASAAWYLRLKNYVAAADIKPTTVFIFFRDDVLTKPELAIGGKKHWELQRLMVDEENIYHTVIEEHHNIGNQITHIVEMLYRVQKRSESARELFNRVSAAVGDHKMLLATLKRGFELYGVGDIDHDRYSAQLNDYHELKQSVNGVFDRSNFRKEEGVKRSEPSIKPWFYDVVESSFLPAMIEIATENKFGLVFVRVQKRPFADGTVDMDETLDRYVIDLNEYLNARGVHMVDMNGHPEIRLEHYLDTDHIAPSYVPEYTEIFSVMAAPHILP